MEILCFELGETHSSGIADCIFITEFDSLYFPFTFASNPVGKPEINYVGNYVKTMSKSCYELC